MDMELSEEIDEDLGNELGDELGEEIGDEPPRGDLLQSTSKRVRMIFSVMASPNRIDILRILNSKGPLTYSELKSLAGFKSKKRAENLPTTSENYSDNPL